MSQLICPHCGKPFISKYGSKDAKSRADMERQRQRRQASTPRGKNFRAFYTIEEDQTIMRTKKLDLVNLALKMGRTYEGVRSRRNKLRAKKDTVADSADCL